MRRPRTKPPAVLGAMLCLLLAASAAEAGPRRYLVMPFENLSSEPSLSWLGEAVAKSLEDRLEVLGMRTVSRRERADALEDLSLPEDAPFTLATTFRLAERMRASRVVTGSFDYDPKAGVMVKARLVDLDGKRQLWQGSRSGSLAKIFTLMDPLVKAAALADGNRVSPAPMDALAEVEDPPLPVYEVIIRSLSEDEPEQRVAALEKGLEIDTRSAPLMRALAFANADAGRVEESLRRIAAIPDESKARDWRLYLLEARMKMAEKDEAGAMEALSRSISVGESAGAHLLMARIYAARGEKDRASAEIDLAEGLDPGHPGIRDLRSSGW